MPRKQHAGRPDQPADHSAGAPQTLGQTLARMPRPKAFPTLASMPRVPRPPAWDATGSDDIRPTARRRAASTARPLTRDDNPAAPDPRAWQTADAWDATSAWADEADADDQDVHNEQWDGAPADGWNGGWEDQTRALAPPAPARDGVALAARSRQRAPARRLLARARSPWSLLRVGLAAVATILALGLGFTQAGEPSQPFMAYQAHAESRAALNVAQAVKPLTSLTRPDQYDSPAQFSLYSPAACSPSAMAEVLTAWGVPHATIGRMIDDLGAHLSPGAGLLDQQGFEAAAAKEGFRADVSWSLTYNQILYLTNQLGLPVIVSFRRDWGYYHYFDGGHFITVTGGDQQGLRMVDSSEYYITYLPRDLFLNLWQWRGDGTAQTIVLVPKDYQYALPAA